MSLDAFASWLDQVFEIDLFACLLVCPRPDFAHLLALAALDVVAALYLPTCVIAFGQSLSRSFMKKKEFLFVCRAYYWLFLLLDNAEECCHGSKLFHQTNNADDIMQLSLVEHQAKLPCPTSFISTLLYCS